MDNQEFMLREGICRLSGYPRVHNDVLSFCGVQDQIIFGYKSQYGEVFSKWMEVAVMDEESEEGQTEHLAPRRTCAQNEDQG